MKKGGHMKTFFPTLMAVAISTCTLASDHAQKEIPSIWGFGLCPTSFGETQVWAISKVTPDSNSGEVVFEPVGEGFRGVQKFSGKCRILKVLRGEIGQDEFRLSETLTGVVAGGGNASDPNDPMATERRRLDRSPLNARGEDRPEWTGVIRFEKNEDQLAIAEAFELGENEIAHLSAYVQSPATAPSDNVFVRRQKFHEAMAKKQWSEAVEMFLKEDSVRLQAVYVYLLCKGGKSSAAGVEMLKDKVRTANEQQVLAISLGAGATLFEGFRSAFSNAIGLAKSVKDQFPEIQEPAKQVMGRLSQWLR